MPGLVKALVETLLVSTSGGGYRTHAAYESALQRYLDDSMDNMGGDSDPSCTGLVTQLV